jgi:hypothetical protein
MPQKTDNQVGKAKQAVVVMTKADHACKIGYQLMFGVLVILCGFALKTDGLNYLRELRMVRERIIRHGVITRKDVHHIDTGSSATKGKYFVIYYKYSTPSGREITHKRKLDCEQRHIFESLGEGESVKVLVDSLDSSYSVPIPKVLAANQRWRIAAELFGIISGILFACAVPALYKAYLVKHYPSRVTQQKHAKANTV